MSTEAGNHDTSHRHIDRSHVHHQQSHEMLSVSRFDVVVAIFGRSPGCCFQAASDPHVHSLAVGYPSLQPELLSHNEPQPMCRSPTAPKRIVLTVAGADVLWISVDLVLIAPVACINTKWRTQFMVGTRLNCTPCALNIDRLAFYQAHPRKRK